jgi:release factor glutamine methyltransferase
MRDASLVVDLCSGSGAIALAVADEFPNARVIAVERYDRAVNWLRRNVVASGVEIVQRDIADAELLEAFAGRVDVVLSNPPYVPTEMRSRVSREVARDPDEAVFAGEDGMALMPAVVTAAARLLRLGGLLVVEHDVSQGSSLPALLAGCGMYRSIDDHLDLTGRPRFATAVRG